MKKLIEGIVEYRRNRLPEYREKFARLALGQSPDCLFIACSDSRVVPNTFASTDPGDLFVVRNVGNLIPCCGKDGHSTADESEAAAIEFAVMKLNVKDIVICGHSDCGAMHALLDGRENVPAPNLQSWLRHGEPSLSRLPKAAAKGPGRVNLLSQLNVLQQIEHLHSYPVVRERVANGTLRLNAWWFELSSGEVFAFNVEAGRFLLIGEDFADDSASANLYS
jgi:carbonic anhydrase